MPVCCTCACIQNTIHLSIVLVLTFRVSKPIKFSLNFTNNIALKLTKRPAFEVRKMNVNLVFIYREVFSRHKWTVRIFTLFPIANLSTDITMFYYHIRLCISLAKDWYLFLKTVSIVALSCNQGKLLLTPTNVNLDKNFCRFCVVIRFFIPATTANDLRLRSIFYPRFYPLHLFSYLNS